MTSSNILSFLGGIFETYYDTTKFHDYWPLNREVTEDGGLVMADSEKPSLFRVKYGQLRLNWLGRQI